MKSRIFLCTLLLGLLFVGCRNKESKASYIPPASMDYSGADTTEILNLVNQYISCLNNHDYDGMADMLYYLQDSRVYPYEGAKRDSLIRGLKEIPIYAAKLYSISLRSNVNNEVGILVQLIENGDLENEIGVSKLYLNPIIIKDKWYLTLLDVNAEGVVR
ncbi:MAG: hypothetical protein IJ209_02720 [Bacteroidaceae bacterium]|nr:hypothetical protein [Bacteroidaceae bacterium]